MKSTSEKRSDVGKTKLRPKRTLGSGFQWAENKLGCHCSPSPSSKRLAQQSPAARPPPKTPESCTTAARQAGRAPLAPIRPGPIRTARPSKGRPRLRGRGRGSRPGLCGSGTGCLRQRPAVPLRGGRTPGGHCSPPVRGRAGSRASGHYGKMTPPSLCLPSRRADGLLPPDAAIHGPLGLSRKPEAS